MEIYTEEITKEEAKALACVKRNRVLAGLDSWFGDRADLANPKFLDVLQICEDAFYNRLADPTEGCTKKNEAPPEGSFHKIGGWYFSK